ncbi:hypothetical protein EC912_101753 [Luteibacter rhizovicinus]|uniref:Uncharacterized protein n=1 Tax=Luteibacter rhizovicinus TaxID=242606 RepID=A0A4R3YYN7_9GAMM|nr:hypothetical protein [Luteibacter rhizovicinus]TCV97736.1 hypothetical protein EC912_101753 [Luteibacter rhizovicinus]
MTVAVLFARQDSVYKTISGTDVYDVDRDARSFGGGFPVVAHPPCRAWGRLRAFAKPRDDEKALALFAVEMVRTWGGVLEHPAHSSLWKAAGLPHPGCIDEFGGHTLPIDQFWFGHRAAKATWLYVCGVSPRRVPAFPMVFGEPTHVIARAPRPDGTRRRAGDPDWRPEVSKAEREHTPAALASWLVDLARSCALRDVAVAA